MREVKLDEKYQFVVKFWILLADKLNSMTSNVCHHFILDHYLNLPKFIFSKFQLSYSLARFQTHLFFYSGSYFPVLSFANRNLVRAIGECPQYFESLLQAHLSP